MGLRVPISMPSSSSDTCQGLDLASMRIWRSHHQTGQSNEIKSPRFQSVLSGRTKTLGSTALTTRLIDSRERRSSESSSRETVLASDLHGAVEAADATLEFFRIQPFRYVRYFAPEADPTELLES